MDLDFLWRAEMACRAAWPAERETELGGWVARRSGGTIRRVNSLNPLPDSGAIDEELIDRTEAYYARFGQPALIRLLSFANDPADELGRRGYERHGMTATLCADLAASGRATAPDVTVSREAAPAWLAARNRIAEADPAIFAAMVDSIVDPKLFAGATVDGSIQSVAYGVLVDGLLVIESVATDAAHRGRGLARQAVGALMAWAAAQGAGQAVLQVVSDNEPAQALYRSLGFATELFDYCYMRQPRD